MAGFFKSLVLAVVLLAMMAAAGVYGYRYDMRKGGDFAIDAVNDISVSWQPEELQKRAHPSLIENIKQSGHQVEQYFAVLSKLGALKKTIDCTLISSGVTIYPNLYLVAQYSCLGDYEKGQATLVLGLIQDRSFGQWQMANFHVESPFFAAPSEQPAK